MNSDSFEQKVIKAIKSIPKGQVATYGQIAAMTGSPRSARLVGSILRKNPDRLPWHRVANKKGEISIVNIEFPAELQKELLEKESVEIKKINNIISVDLDKYLWNP